MSPLLASLYVQLQSAPGFQERWQHGVSMRNLVSDVPAEDVGIILLEAADSGEAVQSSAVLIAMQHAKVRPSNGELPV